MHPSLILVQFCLQQQMDYLDALLLEWQQFHTQPRALLPSHTSFDSYLRRFWLVPQLD